MNQHEKMNYVEFPAKNLGSVKEFFTSVFGWKFTDYGPEYVAFNGEGLDGGFYKSDKSSLTANGATLIVFYSSVLEETYVKIKNFKGKIIQEIFEFPGGKRFHFSDPCGNEYAVWSEK